MTRRIWEWVKSLFRRGDAAGVLSSLDEELGARIKAKQRKEGRLYMPTRFGPNMPRYQPCPKGHGPKKRKSKTAGGANYHCNTCGEDFFVKAK